MIEQSSLDDKALEIAEKVIAEQGGNTMSFVSNEYCFVRLVEQRIQLVPSSAADVVKNCNIEFMTDKEIVSALIAHAPQVTALFFSRIVAHYS